MTDKNLFPDINRESRLLSARLRGMFRQALNASSRIVGMGGLLLGALFAVAACESTSFASDAKTFAVDPEIYTARARTILEGQLKDRKIYFWIKHDPDVSVNQAFEARGLEKLAKLRAGDFEIVPPFEFSSKNPYLPSYNKVLEHCPDIGLEYGTIDGGASRATENFAMYALDGLDSNAGKTAGRSLAYRAERRIRIPVDLKRTQKPLPGPDRGMATEGSIHIFDASNCNEFASIGIQRHDRSNFSTFVNEIIRIEGLFYLLSSGPIGTGPDGGLRVRIMGFNRNGRNWDEDYSFSGTHPCQMYQPKAVKKYTGKDCDQWR